MMQDEFNLLDPHFLERAHALRIVARRVAPAGRWAEHRSRDRGQGLEFCDYRPYSPGDELRSVDWNIYRRFGRVVTRLFEEMEDLPIYLLLDLSHSMWAETDKPRAVTAMQTAIGLAAIGLDQHDRVGIFPFGDELDANTRPTSGRGRLAMFAQMLTRSARGARRNPKGTDLANCVSKFRGLGLREGMIVVLSDFFDHRGVDTMLSQFKRTKHRPLFIAIKRREDRDPSLRGDVRVRDCETRAVQDVSITDTILKRYQQAYDRHFEQLRSFVRRRLGGWLEIDADVDVMDQMATLFEGGRLVS